MRIFRTIFFLGVAAFFLPSPPENRISVAADIGDNPQATEYLAAAVSTVADMRNFCTRQAVVCDTAHFLAIKLEGKAKYSIELIYDWAKNSNGTALPQQASNTSQNTLQIEDLIPEWRAPKSADQG